MENRILIERREHPRYEIKEKCLGRINYGIRGRIINISQGGILVEVKNALKVGSVCSLKMKLAGKEVIAKGVIARNGVYSLEKEAIVYRVGIRFQEMSKKNSQILGKYIRKLSSIDVKRGRTKYLEGLSSVFQELEARM